MRMYYERTTLLFKVKAEKRIGQVMRAHMKSLILSLTLLALLLVPNLASAYYDPGVQRWLPWSSSGWTLTNEVRYVYDGMLVVQERDGNNLPRVTYTRSNDLSGSLQGAGGIGGLLARSEMSNFQSPHA